MFDPLADPGAAVTATMGDKRWRNGATLSLVIVGRILLVVGAIMTDVSVVLPWLHLSASDSEVASAPHTPVELDAGPLTILQLSGGGALLAPACLLAALGIAVSGVGIAFSRRSQIQSALAILMLVLLLLYGGGLFLLVSVAPVALSRSSPYYEASVQYGVGVAVLGTLSAAFGASMVLLARRLRSRDKTLEAVPRH